MKSILLVDNKLDRIIYFIERFGVYDLDIVENSIFALDYLTNKVYDYIFLGGDLGERGGHCVDVAKFLAENENNRNNDAKIIVYSWDIPAVEAIISILSTVEYIPFSQTGFIDMFDL